MIEHNVGYAFDLVVSGHGDYRHREIEGPRSVDSDQPVYRSFQKHSWIFVNQVGAVAVTGDEIEISLLKKMIFDPAHHRSRISVADFRNDDPDGETTLGAQ